jgi:probable phosphoglycerate mutase
MDATRIIAVRHGETAWNADTRIQGQLDIGLNDKGRWQAQCLGAALADEGVHHIYASDLQRAHSTALAIAQRAEQASAHTVQLHTGLRERRFGYFEGQTYADIEARWPEESRRWRQRDPHFAPGGGETPTQVMDRVRTAVHDIAARHVGEHIVLVAHGGVLDMIYRLATGQSVQAPRTWELGNAAINRLLWSGGELALVGWGDVRHLETPALDEGSA